MKAVVLAAVMTVAANSAMAKTFSCYFTEPFITVTASDTDGVVFQTIDNTNVACTKPGVVSSPSKAVFGFPKQTEFGFSKLVIDFTKKGNDGMSDRDYSFEGVLQSKDTTLYGGCEVVE